MPEAPLLTQSGQPDLKIYDRLLTVSLAAVGACSHVGCRHQHHSGTYRCPMRPIQAAHGGRPDGGPFHGYRPRAMPCPSSWRCWSRRPRTAVHRWINRLRGESSLSLGQDLGDCPAAPDDRGAAACNWTTKCPGQRRMEHGVNVLAFGMPGTGKPPTPLCALGHRLVAAGLIR